MSVEIFKDPFDDTSMQGEIFCLETIYPDWDAYDEPGGPLAMKASADPDTMYHHEAMREPDRDEFKKAMQKEIDDQMENGNFEIIKRREVPKGATILPAVWQMKRKRDILSRQVKKWKARLNVDGSRMKKGIHYDQTYAPVASWNSIRTLLALTAIHNWHTVQLDYGLAFPQAPVEKEIYMEIPRGVKLSDGDDTKDYVLKLKRNVYGQKQAGRVWNKYLVDKLVNEVGFKQSEVDECVFYRGNVLYVLYTDDSILAGPDKDEIDKVVKMIQDTGLNITIEGDLQDFLE
jgi:Reverse transcriptase (RNA-dependent DNA polymerase).